MSDEAKNMVGKFLKAFWKAAHETEETFTCALTGGSAAKLLYPELAKLDLEWKRVQFYLSDERCVPSSSPDSNYKLIRDLIPMATVRRVRTELKPYQAAAEYGGALPPQLDLVLLGMGEDGHVASLFPGHALLTETKRKVVAITDSPKPPAERITMTLPALTGAKATWFVVVGEAKRAAADAARNDPKSQLPAALVHRAALSSTWFTDF